MAVKYLHREQLVDFFDALESFGYKVIAPQLRDDAIVYDELTNISQLPSGVEGRQLPGRYQLYDNGSSRCFSWVNGPSALKPYLFKPQQPLWDVEMTAEETDNGLIFKSREPDSTALAVFGIRPCDFSAMDLYDRHFMKREYPDPFYRAVRGNLLTVVVNCAVCAETCFCASTGDGPTLVDSADMIMDELDEGYVVAVGTAIGTRLLNVLSLSDASDIQLSAAAKQREKAAASQKRYLINENMYANLFSQLDSPYWQKIAERCLSCGNCTAVCPTCFCHREIDTPDVEGTTSEHIREWSSCFNADHSVIHGHAVRGSNDLRYRQWMLHKLGSWLHQYGRSGCVGCGRCITWCPAGIDFPAEANAISGEFGLWT